MATQPTQPYSQEEPSPQSLSVDSMVANVVLGLSLSLSPTPTPESSSVPSYNSQDVPPFELYEEEEKARHTHVNHKASLFVQSSSSSSQSPEKRAPSE